MAKQTRKTYKGEKNDKERTMQKLISAVGTVLCDRGYTGLTVSNIAKEAGVDRKLIPLYFGSVEQLVEIYIKGKDYWVTSTMGAMAYFSKAPLEGSKGFLESLLMKQMDIFMDNKEMQKAILWQLSEESKIMEQIATAREKMSALFFTFAEKDLKQHDVDLRAIASILVGAIYYIVLHAENTDSTFCEIDLRTAEGVDRIRAAVKQILDWTYTNKQT